MNQNTPKTTAIPTELAEAIFGELFSEMHGNEAILYSPNVKEIFERTLRTLHFSNEQIEILNLHYQDNISIRYIPRLLNISLEKTTDEFIKALQHLQSIHQTIHKELILLWVKNNPEMATEYILDLEDQVKKLTVKNVIDEDALFRSLCLSTQNTSLSSLVKEHLLSEGFNYVIDLALSTKDRLLEISALKESDVFDIDKILINEVEGMLAARDLSLDMQLSHRFIDKVRAAINAQHT